MFKHTDLESIWWHRLFKVLYVAIMVATIYFGYKGFDEWPFYNQTGRNNYSWLGFEGFSDTTRRFGEVVQQDVVSDLDEYAQGVLREYGVKEYDENSVIVAKRFPEDNGISRQIDAGILKTKEELSGKIVSDFYKQEGKGKFIGCQEKQNGEEIIKQITTDSLNPQCSTAAVIPCRWNKSICAGNVVIFSNIRRVVDIPWYWPKVILKTVILILVVNLIAYLVYYKGILYIVFGRKKI